MWKRSLVLALTVGLALMAHSDPVVAEYEDGECADYISGMADNPFQGTLIGTRKVTETTEFEGSLNPFPGVDGSARGSRTEEYWIGTYVGLDGEHHEVNCSNYTLT